jgi:hypothetical protein
MKNEKSISIFSGKQLWPANMGWPAKPAMAANEVSRVLKTR